MKEYYEEMTDDEQLAMALQMSLQSDSQAMETDGGGPGTSQQANAEAQEDTEFEELAENREFLKVQPFKLILLRINCFVTHTGGVK